VAYQPKAIIYGTSDADNYIAVPVTGEGHLEVAIHSPRLPFGEVAVESLTSVFQTDAVYGLNSTEVVSSTDGAAGTATAASNLFTVGTGGTVAGYYGSIQSRKRLRYRPGQGVLARFTMLFSAGIANNIQVVGVGTSESTFAFGYNGTAFGILHSTDGKRKIETLTISGTVTAGTAAVTLNSAAAVNVTISSTGSATTDHEQTAYELSKGVYPGWTAQQRGATVVWLANSVGAKAGTFSITGIGTPGLAWAETLAGTAVTDTWIPQASWNGDVCDGTGSTSNQSGFNITPTYGNVGEIQVQYLGFGAVSFRIESAVAGNNPDFINVHTIIFPNSQATPSVSQPSFPFLLSTYNIGTAAGAITTSVGSFAGFVAGAKFLTGPRMSYFNNTAITSSVSIYTPLFTIRNSLVFAASGVARANQAIVNLLSVSGATKGNANSITSFFLIKNATIAAGTPSFSQWATTSITDYDVASTEVTFSTNDQVVWSNTISETAQFVFSFEDEITLQPGETLTLAVRSITATSTCIGQINTREDQ